MTATKRYAANWRNAGIANTQFANSDLIMPRFFENAIPRESFGALILLKGSFHYPLRISRRGWVASTSSPLGEVPDQPNPHDFDVASRQFCIRIAPPSILEYLTACHRAQVGNLSQASSAKKQRSWVLFACLKMKQCRNLSSSLIIATDPSACESKCCLEPSDRSRLRLASHR